MYLHAYLHKGSSIFLNGLECNHTAAMFHRFFGNGEVLRNKHGRESFVHVPQLTVWLYYVEYIIVNVCCYRVKLIIGGRDPRGGGGEK